MKISMLKRAVAVICAAVVSISSSVISVGAVDTHDAEVQFSLKHFDYLDSLTKSGDLSRFKKTIDLHESDSYEFDSDELNSKREDIIKHKSKPSEKIETNEKEAYNELLGIVQSLVATVDDRTEGSEAAQRGGAVSEYQHMPRNWRIAEAIYRWVIDNINYDNESLQKDENGKESFRKPQDALFVYSHKMGVCGGKANLVSLMMRMADIPCVVVGAPSHAYNAIYLEDNQNVNRTGWTFLDATWGAPESDINYVEEGSDLEQKNDLIEGQSYFCGEWVKDKFNIDNEYTKAIEKLTSIAQNMEINDKTVNELNSKIKNDLLDLNTKFASDFKFTDIKFVIFNGEFTKYLNVEYKTNLDSVSAKKISEEVNKRREAESYINFSDCLDENGKLYNWFDDWYGKINEQTDRNKEYIEKLNGICSKILNEYEKNEIEKNIEKINQDIKTEIEILNNCFKDIVTIKSFKLKVAHDAGEEYDEVGVPMVDIKANLTLDEAKKIIESKKTAEKELKSQNIAKEYFPAFYNCDSDFKAINEDMINKPAHTIMSLRDGCIHGLHNKKIDLNCYYYLTIDGVEYTLNGKEGESYIEASNVTGNYKTKEAVELPSEIVNLGMPIKIGYGIKSLKLIGDQTVDVSNATSLESVNASASNKYEGYDKNNRKLINKGEGSNILKDQEVYNTLKKQYDDKYIEFWEVRDSLDALKKEKGINDISGYNYDVAAELFDTFDAVRDSNYSADKMRDAIALMDKAIQQINGAQQKLNSKSDDLYNKFLDKRNEFDIIMKEFEKAVKSRGDYSIMEVYDYNITTQCYNSLSDVYSSNYSADKMRDAIALMDKAIEQVNRCQQILNSNN